jgi:hypothetical protein
VILPVSTIFGIDYYLYLDIFGFIEYTFTTASAVWVSIFISIFLWVSFMMRKSYLK